MTGKVVEMTEKVVEMTYPSFYKNNNCYVRRIESIC